MAPAFTAGRAPGSVPECREERLQGEVGWRRDKRRRNSPDGGQMQVRLLEVPLGKARCSSPASCAEILLAACKTDKCSVKGAQLPCCRGSGRPLQPRAELCQVNAHPPG